MLGLVAVALCCGSGPAPQPAAQAVDLPAPNVVPLPVPIGNPRDELSQTVRVSLAGTRQFVSVSRRVGSRFTIHVEGIGHRPEMSLSEVTWESEYVRSSTVHTLAGELLARRVEVYLGNHLTAEIELPADAARSEYGAKLHWFPLEGIMLSAGWRGRPVLEVSFTP